jgi:tetratricopeptide (TPR) repeat protein
LTPPDAGGPAAETTGSILIHYAGVDTAWAHWLARRAALGARAVTLHRAHPAGGRDLRALLEQGAEPGDTVVLVLSRALLENEALTEAQWAERVEQCAAAGVRLLPAYVGPSRWPAAIDRLPALDPRALDEQDAEARYAAALALDPVAGEASGLIRLGEAAQLPPVRFPGRPRRHPIGNVPEPRRGWFYGRDDELDTVRLELERTGRVAVCGTSGNGKTWLAAEYLHRFGSQYDLIAWVRAEAGAMIREDLGRLADALGVAEDAAGEAFRAVAAALRETELRFLIVFDSALPDDLPVVRAQKEIVGEKPARFSELLPPDGRGHVVFTSASSSWDSAEVVEVGTFSVADGADFLLKHVRDLAPETAEEFSRVVDGHPWALNIVSHLLARGGITPSEYLDLAKRDLAELLKANPTWDYKEALSVFIPAQRMLSRSTDPNGPRAMQVLRLLTAFAPEPIPLAMLTSQMEGTRHRPGLRLAEDLAWPLASVQDRAAILEHIRALSLAAVATDHAGGGPALAMHRVTRELLIKLMNTQDRALVQHTAHRLLCDADPYTPQSPLSERRYLMLWRQLLPMGVFECDRVGRPDDPCSALPSTVRNISSALRAKGELTAAVELDQSALAAWTPLLGADHMSCVHLRLDLFNALWQLERIAEAVEIAESALRALKPQRHEYREEYRAAANGMAACMRLLGDWRGSLEADLETREWIEEEFRDEEDNVSRILAGHSLAVALRMMGRFAQALEVDLDCHARCEELPRLGPDNPVTLHSLNNVARDRRELGDYGPAARLQENVVERMAALFGDPRQQHLLRARKNLAVSLRKAGEYEAALALSAAFMADFDAVYGQAHRETAAARTAYANDLRMTGSLREAEVQAALAYKASRNTQADHPFTGGCAVNYAAVLRLLGRPQEAMALDEEAVALFAERLGEEHYYTLAASGGLFDDLSALGRVGEAAILGAQTLERFRRVRGASHPYTLQCAVNHALDLRALGRAEAAEELERDTLARYEDALGPGHPDVVRARDRVRGIMDVEPTPM